MQAMHTGGDLADVRRKFGAIPQSSWSRWTIQARQQVADDDALRQRHTGASAPTTASPAVPVNAPAAAKSATATAGVISWHGQVTMMLEQCDLLASQSIHVDAATGSRRVRNTVVLQQSIRARATALKLAADREAVLYGAERVMFWEDELIKALGRALGKVKTQDQAYLANRIRRAIDGVSRRRADEREFMGGDLTPKTATESTESSNDKPG